MIVKIKDSEDFFLIFLKFSIFLGILNNKIQKKRKGDWFSTVHRVIERQTTVFLVDRHFVQFCEQFQLLMCFVAVFQV